MGLGGNATFGGLARMSGYTRRGPLPIVVVAMEPGGCLSRGGGNGVSLGGRAGFVGVALNPSPSGTIEL